MILHLARRSRIMYMYIDFINKNFDSDEHVFLFTGKSKVEELEKFDNVLYLKNPVTIEKFLFKADKIIIHGLFNKKLNILLAFNPLFLKKSYWVLWGGDLYSYLKDDLSFKEKLYDKTIRTFLIKNLKGIVTLVKGDYDIVKKYYLTNAGYYEGFYPIPVSEKVLRKFNVKEGKRDSVVKVLTGNSGSKENNYIDTFDKIARFKNKNMEIYAVLSYGNQKEYINKVLNKGEELFGDKFKPVKKFMPIDEYYKFLTEIDIYISNHKRQQGLGNLYIMSFLGKKIYIRKDTSMWNFFKNELGLTIYDIEILKDEEYKDFINFEYGEENSLKSKKLFENSYSKNIWEKIW